MRIIYKYPLTLSSIQVIKTHKLIRFLSVQEQRGKICIWAEVEAPSETEHRQIAIFPTGEKIHNRPGEFLGTVQLGLLVFHVYDQGSV